MAIEIIRDYVSSKINGSLPQDAYKELRTTLRYKNSVWRPGFMKQKAWIKEWIELFTPKRQIFPSGLLYMVEEILQKHGVPYTVNDRRIKPIPSEPLPLLHKTLRDYQSETEDICLREGSGIVRMATGGGKTLVFASLLGKYNGLKRIVYVRKLDLMRQTIQVLENELGIHVGQVGGGAVDIQELSVVMIPTAALAVGEKYIKYEYSEDDDSDKDLEMDLTAQQKLAIKEYIEEAECFVVDECHSLGSKSMQMISRHSKAAYHRFGFSASPWREDGADILLNAATGKQLIDINASSLIDRGFLVPPRVHFYRMSAERGQKFPKNYNEMYTQFIVENEKRNKKIVKIVKKLVDNGDRPVVLVQRQKHGTILEELLQAEGLDAQFIYGKTSLANRAYALEQFEEGVIDVVIGSSLPYSEKILVKDEKGLVALTNIGDVVERFLTLPGQAEIQSKNYSVLTVDGKHSVCWKKITAVHKHINTHPIIEARTEGGMTSYVTTNHSMIDENFKEVQPRIGESILSISKVPLDNRIKEVDVVSSLLAKVPASLLSHITVKIFGITQAKVRKMKTDKRFFENPSLIKDKGTLKRVRERIKYKGVAYYEFLQWYFDNVQYKRGAQKSGNYFCDLQSIENLSFDISKYVEDVRIFWKRGSQKHSLPLLLPVNESLIRLCGYFCSEGCSGDFVDKQGYGRGQIHWTADECSQQLKGGVRNDIGKTYKRRIRRDIIQCCREVFGIDPNESKKGVKIDSYLLFVFWKFCLDCGGKASKKRIPNIIYNVSEVLRKEFLFAYFQGDGHLDIQHTPKGWEHRQITLTTSSREMVIGLLHILRSVGYRYVTVNKKIKEEINQKSYTSKLLTADLYTVYVRYCNFCDKIPLSENQVQRGYYFRGPKETNPVTIKRIDPCKEQEYVYDISVEKTERFVGGMGHLLHNSILQEGIDLPCITGLINASGGKSSSAYYQKIGRAIRTFGDEKTRAIVVDFIDEVKWLRDHANARIRILKTEPRYEIKIQKQEKK